MTLTQAKSLSGTLEIVPHVSSASAGSLSCPNHPIQMATGMDLPSGLAAQ
jgi:hypothetical protein